MTRSAHFGAVAEPHANLFVTLHNVMVGEQESIWGRRERQNHYRRGFRARRGGSQPAGRSLSATPTTAREKASSTSSGSGCSGFVLCGSPAGTSPPLVMKCCQNRDIVSPSVRGAPFYAVTGKRNFGRERVSYGFSFVA